MSRNIPSDAVNHGRNRDLATHRDNRYVRCWNCGLINNLDRETHSPRGSHKGDGFTFPETQLNAAVTAGDATITVDATSGFPTPASGTITAFADTGQRMTKTTVTSTAHGLKDQDIIVIASTTNYNGTFKITDIATNTFSIYDKYVADDATGTWTRAEYFYVYDTDIVNSTTGSRSDKVSYTGLTSLTFTGCSGARAHADDMYVRGEQEATSGCRLCGCGVYHEEAL